MMDEPGSEQPMNDDSRVIHGRMRLEVRDRGVLVAQREASNIVVRGGAELVALRFAGQDCPPIDRVSVGFGRDVTNLDATELTPPAGTIDPAALSSPIAPADFKVATDRPAIVVVSLASVFHPTVDLPDVSEAGLLGGDRLYNQVVFEPIRLRVGQDVTFFWEIHFPFGH
jgi:hypothetical protein